jgi:phosphoglycolate phosphatase-like HAD superfamily hydrolase
MSKPKTIIFDFDGTIADSFAVFLNSLQIVLGRDKPLTTDEVAMLQGATPREIMRYLHVKKWQLPRLLIKGRQEISQHMDEIAPFPNIANVLKNASSEGHAIYILSTNSEVNIRGFLQKHKLEPYIKGVYGNVSIFGKTKTLKKLSKRQKVAIADCVYIGDEVRDIEAAKKAGMACISVAWGFSTFDALKAHQPTVIAKRPDDLLTAIKTLTDR